MNVKVVTKKNQSQVQNKKYIAETVIATMINEGLDIVLQKTQFFILKILPITFSL